MLDALITAGHLVSAEATFVRHLAGVEAVEPIEILDALSLVDHSGTDPTTVPDARGDLPGEWPRCERDALRCLPPSLARRHATIPIRRETDPPGLVLAIDRRATLDSRDAVRRALPSHWQVRWIEVTVAVVRRAIDRHYGIEPSLERFARPEGSPDAVACVDAMFADAVARRATDIHVTPRPGHIAIRLRVDGILRTALCLPTSWQAPVLVHLKVLAGLDLGETRRPQDGGFTRVVDGEPIRFRVSTMPGEAGENLVLRVLGWHAVPRQLSGFRFGDVAERSLETAIARPDGLIVFAGPTGCGKSTTLHALLAAHDLQRINAMSVEDPIERRLARVTQVAVNPAVGLDYGTAIRALLRQDPDLLLIGEIRDRESCAMALRAAMSGHKVLTTVHADDAIAAFDRLEELGAERARLRPLIALVASQRLFRTRCRDCAPVGRDTCPACQGSGYRGRRAIAEAVDRDLALALLEGDSRARRVSARKLGFVDIATQADRLVANGELDDGERVRVLGPRDPSAATIDA